MLYLAAPKTEQATRTTTYNAATGAAQHAAGAAEQHVRNMMKPPIEGTNP
jgi:ABC-type sulfate transport system substrate-binding protein